MRFTSHHISYLIAALATVSALASSCYAQEVASLDLTKVTGRLDLRRPKATSPATHGYSGTQRTTGCFDPTHKTGSLQATLVSLDRTHYQLEDEPRFEVTLENTGSEPISIPFSPHLADLQPENPGQKFDYSELQIELWIASGDRWSTNTGGFVKLYGAEGHKGTMVRMNPGEWVRIIGRGHLLLEGEAKHLIQEHPADQLYAVASVYRDQTLITATQSATVQTETCIDQTHGRGFPIELTIP